MEHVITTILILVLLVISSPIWIAVMISVGLGVIMTFIYLAVIVFKLLCIGFSLIKFIFYTVIIAAGILVAGGCIFYLFRYFRLV